MLPPGSRRHPGFLAGCRWGGGFGGVTAALNRTAELAGREDLSNENRAELAHAVAHSRAQLDALTVKVEMALR